MHLKLPVKFIIFNGMQKCTIAEELTYKWTTHCISNYGQLCVYRFQDNIILKQFAE